MENIRGKDMKEKNASELLKSGEQRTLERLANMDIDFSILVISNIFNILLIHIFGASLKLMKFYE